MKVTVFTSNHKRHSYLINRLSEITSELCVVQESRSVFPGLNQSRYLKNIEIEKYFREVNKAQDYFFNKEVIKPQNKIVILPLTLGDLSKIDIADLDNFLKSDLYIVFGSSYIKGELCDYLIRNKAINIHMGLSPFYRGTDCNFWALMDNNFMHVGSTIHYLSDGLDNGDIIYHALPKYFENPFLFTMSSVKSAIDSLVLKINDKSIVNKKGTKQDKKLEIRYSKISSFTDHNIQKFYQKKIIIKKFNYDKKLLVDPYFLM